MPEKDDNTGEGASDLSRWGWEVGTVLVLSGVLLTYAVEVRNWKLAQLGSLVGMAFLCLGVLLLSKRLSLSLVTERAKSTQNDQKPGYSQQREARTSAEEVRDVLLRDILLQRLVMVAGFGLTIIFIYAVQYKNWPAGRVLSTLSVGLVSAGAAWLIGALLGFLFGIPHTREGTPQTSKVDSETSGEPSASDSRYSPSTSLDQISDWLTKIIVGIGLTQLNNIPHKLNQLSQYIAVGMGDDPPNLGFALGIILYFSVSGFLFGYLWGRLYMLGLFREADVEKAIKEGLEKISTQILDQRAKDLVEQQLDLNAPEVNSVKLQDAIQKATDDERKEIFKLVFEARRAENAREPTKIRAIRVLQSLINTDVVKQPEYYAELGNNQVDLGNLKDAIEALSTAINIRDRRGWQGWGDLEFKRAIARIRIANDTQMDTPDLRKQIQADIERAFKDSKNAPRFRINEEIKKWLEKTAPENDKSQ